MSRKRTCAISSSISFLTSADIPIHLEMFATAEDLSTTLSAVEIITWTIALSNLLIVIQSIYSLSIQRSP